MTNRFWTDEETVFLREHVIEGQMPMKAAAR